MTSIESLDQSIFYFVTSERGGPPLFPNQINNLQNALDAQREDVRIAVMTAIEFMSNPPKTGGVIWTYFRGIPAENEDVLGLLANNSQFTAINNYKDCPHGLDNKWVNYQHAVKAAIPIPESFGINDPEQLQNLTIEFPIILKGYPSGRGEDVHLCETLDDAKTAYQKCIDKGLGIVAQEFIAESRGRDLRVISVDGKIAIVLGRQGPAGSFLSNVSQGGRYFEYSINDDERRTIEAAIKQFPADVAGFDFLFSNRGLLFCEINLAPGWTGEALPFLTNLIRSRLKNVSQIK